MKKSKIHYGWWIVIGCMLITSTIVPVTMALAGKFLIPITEEMGVSRSAFSLVSSLLQGLGIIVSPIVAKKLAKGDMKKIHSVSVIGFALAYASYSLAQNVFHLYISAVFVGLFFFCTTMIPVSMMITNWFVKKRGLAMSLAMTGIGIGGFIFSPVITWLLATYGWRWSYRIMALIVLAIALPASLFILRKSPEDMGMKAYGADDEESAAQSVNPQRSTGISLEVSETQKKFFFYLLLIGFFANGLINAGSLGQFPPAIQELHGPAIQAAIISLYSIVGIFGKLILGWINDRFGIVASCVYGCLTFALSFVFMLMGANVMMLYVMGFSYGLGNAIGSVSPPLVVGAIYGPKKYGQAFGIVNSASQIGMTLGSLTLAAIYDLTGSYTWAWILMLAMTVVTFLAWVGAYINSRKYQEKN